MKNVENKWIGWVEDHNGYMIHFVAPTSKAWAKRKAREMCEALKTPASYSWVQLNYAVRNKLSGCGRGDKWFARLNEVDLNVLMSVVQG
jgi:hypothetical protein